MFSRRFAVSQSMVTVFLDTMEYSLFWTFYETRTQLLLLLSSLKGLSTIFSLTARPDAAAGSSREFPRRR